MVSELERVKVELEELRELLQKERETFFPILHQAPYGIALLDARGELIYVNPAFTAIVGYSLEELFSGRGWFQIAAPFLQQREELLRLCQGGKGSGPLERTFSIICKGGEIRQIESRPTLLDDGRIVLIISDVTERKRAADALRESEEKYRGIIENIEDGYFEVDLEGRLAFVNDAFCRMLRYPKEDLLGRPPDSYIELESARHFLQALQRVGETGEAIKGFDCEMIAQGGTKLFWEVSISPMRDRKGKRIGFRGLARDVTDRRRAEQEKAALQEELRRSQKMEAIGVLAGGIAHDFNNLLTVISGYCQLSLLELKPDHPLRSIIDEIKAAADRATCLTRQLLAFGRRQTLDMRPLDLNRIIGDMERMLRRLIGEDIELVTVLAEDLGRVKADRGWMEQVVMNLCVNARDAMPSGGKLTIETVHAELDETFTGRHPGITPGHYVKLCVSDTGRGMTSEVKQHLFEPFFTTKERGRGTGLGLSTVYGIIKECGGHIWVDSEPGRGTTFHIYLPRVDEPEVQTAEPALRGEPMRGRETLMVVEDEEDVRRLAARVLERQGYKVLEASSANEAIKLCEEHKGSIDAILTDVVMPGMTGPQLMEQLLSRYPKIKVLYMSGYADHSIFQRGIPKGKGSYLQKPFTVDGLTRKIREVLDQGSPYLS